MEGKKSEEEIKIKTDEEEALRGKVGEGKKE